MKSFFILLLLTLVVSCGQKAKPPGVLSENKMWEVMEDMIRADQYVSNYLQKDSTRNKKDESTKLYAEIFSIHKITKEQFKKSLDYYTSRPDFFRPIIDSLAKRKNNTFISPASHATPTIFPLNKINKDSIIKARHYKNLPNP